MISKERLEGYMTKLSLTYEEVGELTWIIRDEEKGLENVVVAATDPLVMIRVKVMEIPAEDREAFFEELLRLNATDVVHGAYALDGNDVLLVETLEGETMDIEELQASLDAIGLALVQHYRQLSKYRKNRT